MFEPGRGIGAVHREIAQARGVHPAKCGGIAGRKFAVANTGRFHRTSAIRGNRTAI